MRDVLVAVVVSFWVVTISAACALQQKQVERELSAAGPVDCSTAHGDLRLLYHEKASVDERVTEGIRAIYPAGIVVGLATGTEATRVKVASGEYNKAIDKRIAQIRQTCGMEDQGSQPFPRTP